MKKYKKYLVLAICFCVIFALDMFTKNIFEGKSFSIIKGVLGIFSCHNTGAAFSMFSDKTLLLTVFTSLLLIFLVTYYCFCKKSDLLFEISYSFIISGAIGNLVDRIMLGYVRDFISLEFVNFAIFNIADSALTLGIIGLCVFIIFFDKENDNSSKIKEQKC